MESEMFSRVCYPHSDYVWGSCMHPLLGLGFSMVILSLSDYD